MAKIMPHADCPCNFTIQAKSLADGGCNGRDVQAMFHSRTDVVIAGSKEYLGLVLESTKRGRVYDGRRITIVRAAYIL